MCQICINNQPLQALEIHNFLENLSHSVESCPRRISVYTGDMMRGRSSRGVAARLNASSQRPYALIQSVMGEEAVSGRGVSEKTKTHPSALFCQSNRHAKSPLVSFGTKHFSSSFFAQIFALAKKSSRFTSTLVLVSQGPVHPPIRAHRVIHRAKGSFTQTTKG